MVDVLKKRWFQVLGLLVLVAGFAIFAKYWGSEDVVRTPNIIAEVKGRQITAFEFTAAVNRRLTRLIAVTGRLSSADKEGVMLSVFRGMLFDKILAISAGEEGVVVTAEDIMKKKSGIILYLEKQAKYMKKDAAPTSTVPDAEAMYSHLWSTLGFRQEEEFLEYLKYEIYEDKLAKHLFPEEHYTVSDVEVEANLPRVELRQIFFIYNESQSSGSDINYANKKQYNKAWKVYEQLKQGADFAKLAKKYSQEAYGAEGGYIGWITMRSVVPLFWDIAKRMQPGEISEPFATSQGLHIIKCINVLDPDGARFRNFRKVAKKAVIIRKQKADFVGWFYQRLRKLEENDDIKIYQPVIKANKLRNMGRMDEAVKAYREAIKTDKEGAPYYHIDISMIYARQKRYSEALRELRMATEEAPTDPKLFFAMGRAYMEVGEHEKGLAEFRKASDLSKLDYNLHQTLGQIYSKLGLVEEANEEQDRAVHAFELLKGSGGPQMPGGIFKAPEYKMPSGLTDKGPDSVRENIGLPDESMIEMQQ